MDETLLNPPAGPQSAPPPVSPAPEPSAPAPSQDYAPPSAPADAGQGKFTSIRDHVAGLGLQDVASQYQDDESFVAYLVQQHQAARQAAHLTPYAQRYLQHANDFERFLSDRQQSQQQQKFQQQQKPKFWNPPEYNSNWARSVTRDESGNLVLAPGASPEVLPKVAAYDQYVRDFVSRFTNNPQEALTPLISEVVEPLIQQALGQQMGTFQERSVARDFLNNNSNWLYHTAATGGYARDGDGHLVLSENGNLFANLVYEAEQMGLDTVAKQQRYAARVLAAAGRYGTPGGAAYTGGTNAPSGGTSVAQSVNDQQKQAFLNRPNPAGSFQLAAPTPQPLQSDTQLSLADRLRRDLAAGGVNDSSLAEDYR